MKTPPAANTGIVLLKVCWVFYNWNQVLRAQYKSSENSIRVKGTQTDPRGQTMAAVYILTRQIQDKAVCKPEFQELLIRIVLQMFSS